MARVLVIIKLNYTTHMLRVKSHWLYHSQDPDQATFESAMAVINCGVQVTIDHWSCDWFVWLALYHKVSLFLSLSLDVLHWFNCRSSSDVMTKDHDIKHSEDRHFTGSYHGYQVLVSAGVDYLTADKTTTVNASCLHRRGVPLFMLLGYTYSFLFAEFSESLVF